MTEAQLHEFICNYLRAQYNDLIFFSDMSGVRLPMGLAKKCSVLKSCRGIPDLFIAEPRGDYKGFFLEIKRDGVQVYKKDGEIRNNKHLIEQDWVMHQLRERGYYAEFGVGEKDVLEQVDGYLKKLHKNY